MKRKGQRKMLMLLGTFLAGLGYSAVILGLVMAVVELYGTFFNHNVRGTYNFYRMLTASILLGTGTALVKAGLICLSTPVIVEATKNL